MPRKKKIKVGIIGVGGISGVHYSGYTKSPDAELWAICDIKPDVLAEKSEKYGVPEERCFLDHRDLLAHRRPRLCPAEARICSHFVSILGQRSTQLLG